MLKRIFLLLLIAIVFISMMACGIDNGGNDKKNNENNEVNMPKKLYNGTINFTMPFGDQLDAYKVLASEYKKYQPNVTVNLRDESQSTYQSIILNDVSNQYNSSSANLFAGNYINAMVDQVAIDMYPYILRPNQYTFDSRWRDCLTTAAYTMPGVTSSTKMMGTNTIAVAWYYNKTVISQAQIDIESMANWDDFMAACQKAKDIGYNYPLGVSIAGQSYAGSQLSWLLRVYGDQFYRDLYPDIQAQDGDFCYDTSLGKFEYNDNDPLPEDSATFNMNMLRLQSLILDKSVDKYSGPTSKRFKELMENIFKMAPYLAPDATTTSDELTGKFVNGGKDDPVFYIDVLGFGSKFSSLVKDSPNKFELGIFDFLPMDAQTTVNRTLRSLGGNSAWLAVRDSKNKETNDMCVDFISFFMSPYGQKIFIQALIDTDSSLAGPSTVKSVSYPDEWAAVYENTAIEQNGLCDRNQFIAYLINPFELYTNWNTSIYSSFVSVIKTNNGIADSSFYDNYYTTALQNLERINQSKGYNRAEAWKTPAVNPL